MLKVICSAVSACGQNMFVRKVQAIMEPNGHVAGGVTTLGRTFQSTGPSLAGIRFNSTGGCSVAVAVICALSFQDLEV